MFLCGIHYKKKIKYLAWRFLINCFFNFYDQNTTVEAKVIFNIFENIKLILIKDFVVESKPNSIKLYIL